MWKYLPGNLYSHLAVEPFLGKYFMYLNPYQILKLYYFHFHFFLLLFFWSCGNYGKSNSEWKYKRTINFMGNYIQQKKMCICWYWRWKWRKKISISLVFYWIKSKKRKIKHQQIEAVQKFTRVDFRQQQQQQQKKRDGSGTTTKYCHE